MIVSLIFAKTVIKVYRYLVGTKMAKEVSVFLFFSSLFNSVYQHIEWKDMEKTHSVYVCIFNICLYYKNL